MGGNSGWDPTDEQLRSKNIYTCTTGPVGMSWALGIDGRKLASGLVGQWTREIHRSV